MRRKLRAKAAALAIAAIVLLAWSTSRAEAGGMPYALFDGLRQTRIEIGGGHVDVAVASGDLELPRAGVVSWVAAAAAAVTAYYGRLPVPRVRVLVLPGPGRGIHGGTTFGYDGAAIKVGLGRDTLAADLAGDWVMTHEMVHLAVPGMADDHDWLDEGLATYVEPLGRAQAGQIPPEKVWADLVWGLPKGLPEPGDSGLDHTSTWGRT